MTKKAKAKRKKSPKYLTEAQAWTWLAALWSSPVEVPGICGGDGSVIGADKSWGLCHQVHDLLSFGRISKVVHNRMLSRIDLLRRFDNGFCWPHTHNGACKRVEYCLRQAYR